jgi:hypothetical protein
MYTVFIFSAFFQLEVAFFFSCGVNGFESWNYGFEPCIGHEFLFHVSSDFIVMKPLINNIEALMCEMNIRNLTETGLYTAECTAHFIISEPEFFST